MFSITRITSLVLAFTLGFSMCLGIIAFGAMTAVSSFRVRDLERYGIIANIPDESFMKEDPEVDIFDLSLVDFINELKFITSLGDDVNLNYVQERYGLIFHEKLNAVLSDEARTMPLKQLFSKDGFGTVLGSVYIGDIETYICYNADGTEGGTPGVDGSYWMTKDGTKITGIEEIIANFSINDFVSGNINTDTLFDEISIGDVLGYTQDGENWFDKDGKKVTGVIGAFAGSTIHSVGSDINDIKIGEILGYETNENGDWCKANEETGELEKVTGALGVFAGCGVNDIGDRIETAKLGEILGYELVDGVWHKRNTETNELEKVTGVLATFADSTINGIGDKMETAKLGELLGYELVDGVWHKRNTETDELEKVTGVLAVFADCNIDGIGDKLETAKLGEILGYELDGETWYKRNAETNELEKVTGVMAVFADSGINGIGDKIETAELGELLGYEKGEGDKWYKRNSETDELEKITGVMAVFSDCNINGIGDKLEDAQLGELLGYELVDNVWYKYEIDSDTKEEKKVKVSGAMAVFADSNINGVGDQIEKTEVGKLLGYELIEGVWYEPADKLDEDGNRVPVSGFMSKISASTINNMGGVFDTLVIGDIVKAEDRKTGLFAIIEPDTKIDEIGSAVNNSIMNSPLQFFINEKLISFVTGEGDNQQDMGKTLDVLSGNDIKKIYLTDEKFETEKSYYKDVWSEVKDSNGEVLYYTVPNWRTQPLTSSFAYIIKLLTNPQLPFASASFEAN